MILNGLADGCIVINLDSRQDKLQQTKEELEKVKVPFIRQKGITVQDKTLPIRYAGHVGCGLSHIAAYKKALSLGWKKLFVVEDDIVFVDSFLSWLPHIEECFRIAKPLCDIFYFWTKDKPDNYITEWVSKIGGTGKTHAMILSEMSMRWMISFYEPVVNYFLINPDYRENIQRYNNEIWIIDQFYKRHFVGNMWATNKQIIYTRENFSDIDQSVVWATNTNTPKE